MAMSQYRERNSARLAGKEDWACLLSEQTAAYYTPADRLQDRPMAVVEKCHLKLKFVSHCGMINRYPKRSWRSRGDEQIRCAFRSIF
jgi:hypothetical protein